MSNLNLCDCHNETVVQKKFFQKNGKRRPLSHEEFEKLRGAEAARGNHFSIPGVIFRWTCPVTSEIVTHLDWPKKAGDVQSHNSNS